MQHHTPAMNGIFNRSVIGKGDFNAYLLIVITGGNSGFGTLFIHHAYLQGGFAHHAPAKYFKALIAGQLLPYGGNATVYFMIVLTVNKRFNMPEQLQFFIHLLPHIYKTLT